MSRRPVVGITIFAFRTGMSWWSNGAHQNCAALWLCLRRAGYDVRMVNGGDGIPPALDTLPPELAGLEFVPISDAVVDELDILIQAGAQVSAEHVERVHARGGKCVTFKFGADFPIDAERAIHNLPAGAIFNGAKFDEVWTTAQHFDTCGSYWAITYRCPVRVLPHIWSPCFVDHVVRAFPTLEAKRSDGTISKVPWPATPGYVPGRPKKRIVILEPNINLIKTAHIPMLIAEEAFRRAPEKIDRVLVTNAEQLKTRESFNTFAANLDIVKTKTADGHCVMSFEGRFNTPWFMAAHGDIVVSHQWLPSANYSHYDLLHLGYPIVHNCPDLASESIGFYYVGFDALAGACRLLDCISWQGSKDYVTAAMREGREFVATRHATNRANVEAHAKAIEKVWQA